MCGLNFNSLNTTVLPEKSRTYQESPENEVSELAK